VEVPETESCPARYTLLLHQAGHVRRNHVFGPVAQLVLDLVEPHSGGHGLVCHTKCAAKTATFIGSVHGYQYQSLDLRKQRFGLIERLPHRLRRLGKPQPSHRTAAIVNCNRVRELGPGKGFDLENVVEELNQLVSMLANMRHVVSLIHRVEVATYLFNTASSRTDGVVVLLEDVDKQALGRGCIRLVTAIGHRLPTAGLV